MITHHSVMKLSLLIKSLKITFLIFSSDIDYNSMTDVLREVSPIQSINVSLGVERTPLADTLCLPVAQHKQAKRTCL